MKFSLLLGTLLLLEVLSFYGEHSHQYAASCFTVPDGMLNMTQPFWACFILLHLLTLSVVSIKTCSLGSLRWDRRLPYNTGGKPQYCSAKHFFHRSSTFRDGVALRLW